MIYLLKIYENFTEMAKQEPIYENDIEERLFIGDEVHAEKNGKYFQATIKNIQYSDVSYIIVCNAILDQPTEQPNINDITNNPGKD